MDIALKQRLVGAVVLISLAVIFLPMVFTVKNDEEVETFKTNIPPEPVYEINAPSLSDTKPIPSKMLERVPLAEPVAKPIVKESLNIPPAEAQNKTVQKGQSMDNGIDSQENRQSTSSSSVQANQTSTIKKPLTPASPSAGKESVANVSAHQKEQKVASGWVVQVGSFSKQSNAVALRDRLRKMQITSFVAKGDSKKGPVYRVRVGPVLKRRQAEQLKEKILEETKLKGYVTKYP